MDDVSRHRTAEGEIVRVTPGDRKPHRAISAGLAKYFGAVQEQLNYLEYGDPAEYLLRTKKEVIPNSPLDSIWIPPRFKQQDNQTGEDILLDTLLLQNSQVVLGDPGCGKSTLARFLTCYFIKLFLTGEQEYFGMLVPLSKIRISGRTDEEAAAYCAAEHVGLANDKDVVADLVQDFSNACIVFDGLDELPIVRKVTDDPNPPPLRRDAASLIRTILYVHTCQTEEAVSRKIIVTSRSKDYFEDRESQLDKVPRFFISKFSAPQMSLAVEKWHDAARVQVMKHLRGDEKLLRLLSERQRGIQGALRDNSDLANICLTPLMLNVLQTVYSDANDLPSSVSQLCWRAINWFFVDKHRGTSQDSFVSENGDWLIETITEIGWYVQERVVAGQSRVFDDTKLRALVSTSCPKENFSSLDYETREDAITSVASFLRKGHGILIKLPQDEFDFVHNVFREVMAGRSIGKRTMTKRRELALNLLWHAPIRYWAGLKALDIPGLSEIGMFVGELSKDVKLGNVEAILACSEMLVEVCSIVPFDRRPQIIKDQISDTRGELYNLLKQENLSLSRRIQVGDMLATLGDLRLDTPVVERLCWVEEGRRSIGRNSNHQTRISKYQKCPAAPPITGRLRKFGIGSFLVTNREFRAFVEDGGYGNVNYWPNEMGLKWAQGDPGTLKYLIEQAQGVASVHLSSELARQRLVVDEIPTRCNQMIERRLPMYWMDPAQNRPNQPVVGVNWWEAVAYCLWLDKGLRQADRIKPDQLVRLPIEAEWETAARLCGNGVYPWQTGSPAESAHVKAAFDGTKDPPIFRSCAVGLFEFVKTNRPIYDLVGNVWEWTASKARPYSQQSFYQILDTNGIDDRIARGSSWLSSEEEATQITFRSFDPPYNAYEDLGFRIVIADRLPYAS